MRTNTRNALFGFFISAITLSAFPCMASEEIEKPAPHSEAPSQHIVFAGGCFWGMQAVFQHTKGVDSAVAGYAGGTEQNAKYEIVSTGSTGHAESVDVAYDPARIGLDTLLDIYFTVAHNPTELNYQGPDHGTQYRSTVFTGSPEQRETVEKKIAALNASGHFRQPVVTDIESLTKFYPAEDYHQNYATLHPYDPYIMINDAPKVSVLKKQFPQLYKD